jgi:biotin carboxyl carrier protein
MILAADQIAELTSHMRGLGIAEVEIADGDEILRVALPEAIQQPVAEAPHQAISIAATACGSFFLGHPVRETPPSIGARFEAGEIVGVIAAGPLLRPVEAPAAATLIDIFCEQGQRVDFGTPLLALAPLDSLTGVPKRKDA